MKINERQQKIIDHIENSMDSITVSELNDVFGKDFKVSRRAIIRDVQGLVKNNFLEEIGGGRSTAYKLSKGYYNKKYIDIDAYFSKNFAMRDAKPWFDEYIFNILNDNIFTNSDLERLNNVEKKYKEIKNKLEKESPAILRRELERFIIELSWKSSEIEGNTYTLLETEALLKEHQIAKGKDKQDTQMILNHKKALDYVLVEADSFNKIDINKIKLIHSILISDLDIKADFRNHAVGITGTLYRPPQDKKRITELIEHLVNVVQDIDNRFVKAFVLLIMISYIQPFEDGNKRTARIVANAVLNAGDMPMLSYRNVEATEYKKAVLLFYEQNNITYIKDIFIEQVEFAVNNYFLD